MDKNCLFKKDFTLVVIGQIISLFGNAILRFALPLYLLRETGSSALFGLVTACSFVPMIVLSLLGGVLADRVNKRNIMVGLDLSTAVLIMVFYLLLGKAPVVPLFLVTLMILYGISGTYQPAVQASIPALVDGENILAGNAVINQISSLAGLLGPVIGGMLYGAWGIVPILLISILCFFTSAVMEMFIQISHVRREEKKHVFKIVKDDLKESIDFIRKERPIFVKIIVIVSVFNLVFSPMIIVGMPVLVVDILGMSDSQLGFSQGALALGGLAGGILMGVMGKILKVRRVYIFLLIAAVTILVNGMVLLWGLSPLFCYLVISAMSFVAMAVSTMLTIQIITYVQMNTPPILLGKVMACLMTLALCTQPIGQAIYGVLFQQFRDTSWMILIGASLISVGIALYSKKVFHAVDET